MRQANGNQTHAARLLDISRDALRYKLTKFGIVHVEEEESGQDRRSRHRILHPRCDRHRPLLRPRDSRTGYIGNRNPARALDKYA
jgi:Bacterial regulatory protein, Fis family